MSMYACNLVFVVLCVVTILWTYADVKNKGGAGFPILSTTLLGFAHVIRWMPENPWLSQTAALISGIIILTLLWIIGIVVGDSDARIEGTRASTVGTNG